MSAEPRPSREGPYPHSGHPSGADAHELPLPSLADAAAPLPEDPAEQAFSLLLSGELKFRQRNLLEAESYLRRAVELHSRLPDADPGERLRALDALGAVYVARGDLARAEPILREALGRADAMLGDDHEGLGPYLNQLALVLFKRKRFAEAEPVLARLVAIKRRLGDEHPEVASVVANLALVHEALQRYDSAETLWRCALVIRQKSLPDDSPAVTMAREHLADMCATNGRPEEAIALRERALVARATTLPGDHPQVAAAKAKLTALKVEGVRAKIPVVVPQARTTERFDPAPTPQPIPRPPGRGPARSPSRTPPLPRDVLDEIVRATTETPSHGVMAGMRGRAKQFLERPLLKLVKPRADVLPDARPVEEEDEYSSQAPPPPAAPPRPRPEPQPQQARPAQRVIIPRTPDVTAVMADAAPDTWDEEDLQNGDLPDDDAPRSRFDLFGDKLWPKTRMVLAVVALTLVLAVGAAAIARMAGGTPPNQSNAPAASVASQPAQTSDPAAVPADTRKAMDAGLRAMERASQELGVARPRPVSATP